MAHMRNDLLYDTEPSGLVTLECLSVRSRELAGCGILFCASKELARSFASGSTRNSARTMVNGGLANRKFPSEGKIDVVVSATRLALLTQPSSHEHLGGAAFISPSAALSLRLA